MKLNPLLLLTALPYGVAGLALTFAPDEVLAALEAPPSPVTAWLGQLLGAALLALAWLNWLQRYATVGGILGRPLLLTNLLFATAAFGASLSAWRAGPSAPVFVVAAALFGALAAAYGARLFRPAPSR